MMSGSLAPMCAQEQLPSPLNLNTDPQPKSSANDFSRTSQGNVTLTVRVLADNSEEQIPINGHLGLTTLLPPRPVYELAVRHEEWITRSNCSASQWEQFAHARTRYLQCKATIVAPSLSSVQPQPAPADHAPTRGQQTMHAFGRSSWCPGPDPDADNLRTGYFQSLEDWAFDARNTESTLSFDTRSMEVVHPVLGSGSWEARARHGQATVIQHPRQYRRHFNSVVPLKEDTVVDAAQLQSIMERCSPGAGLHDIPDLCQRQAVLDAGVTLSRHFTSSVQQGCQLHSQWGASPLSSDPSFSHLISPNLSDIPLGSQAFDAALPTVADASLILLDPFSAAQQDQILQELAQSETGRWMLITSSLTGAQRTKLEQSSFLFDEVLRGHKLAQAALAWRTGDVTAAALASSVQVWIPRHADIPVECWDEWISPTAPPGHLLNDMPQAAQDYWARRQDGEYSTRARHQSRV